MPDRSKRPLRIAFEGVDGVGKSTVIRAIRRRLAQNSKVLVDTLAPVTLDLLKQYGQSVGGNPQAYWTLVSRRTKTQCFLTEGIARSIYLSDAYLQCDIVLYDRWWQTFRVYSKDDEEFDDRCRFLAQNLPPVDLLFYLHDDRETCAARLIADDDWLVREVGEENTAGFLEHLHAGYQEVLADDGTVIAIDRRGRTVSDIANQITQIIAARMLGSEARGALDNLDQRLSPTKFQIPDKPIYAVEGMDGAGKTTVCSMLGNAHSRQVHLARLSEGSLAMFKHAGSAMGGLPASTAIRRQFEDEFRHQTYIIDGLVQLSCLAERQSPARAFFFDRWFPAYALYQDQIASDRQLFDFLLSRFPQPDALFHIDLDPAVAAARLAERGDWMIQTFGEAGTRDRLAQMRAVYAAKKTAMSNVRLLDGQRTPAALVEEIARCMAS
jgi:thymidylate kinase